MMYAAQLAILVFVPLYLAIALFGVREPRSIWWLKVLYGAAYVAYVWMVGRWDLTSVYVRYAIVFVFALSVALSFLLRRAKPLAPQRQGWLQYVAPGALLIAFSGFAAWAARGYVYSDDSVELRFPLRDGWYYVGQGGNSRIINYHNVIESQRYALDIVALDRMGRRADGFMPQDLARYTIFEHAVRSPCEGRVETAVDGLPDLVPPATDRNNPAGNHVAISCSGALVVLAHLRQGSVQVQEGDSVQVGDLVGRVGNSGNTSEPHLHIHAVREGSGDILSGEGVPIVFDGAFLVRNSIVGSKGR